MNKWAFRIGAINLGWYSIWNGYAALAYGLGSIDSDYSLTILAILASLFLVTAFKTRDFKGKQP